MLDAPWDLNEGPCAVPDAHVSRLTELEAFSEMEEETQEVGFSVGGFYTEIWTVIV